MRPCLLIAMTLLGLAAMTSARAESNRVEMEAIVDEYLARHPERVQAIVKDYLTRNPDVVQNALIDMIKKRVPGGAPAADKSALIRSNATALYASPHQVVLGNPDGDVTLVEFFDYNCGYCKRALGDLLALM